MNYTINFDKTPELLECYTLLPDSEQLPNRVRGKIKFDPSKIKLHLDSVQAGGGVVRGDVLRKKLANQPVYGIQLREFLLKHPQLIPKEWERIATNIYFWGGLVNLKPERSLSFGGKPRMIKFSHPFVLSLRREEGNWYGAHFPLKYGWGADSPCCVYEG